MDQKSNLPPVHQSMSDQMLESLKLVHIVEGWEFIEVSHAKMIIEQAKRDLLSKIISEIMDMGSGKIRGNEVLSKWEIIKYLESKI